LQHIQSTTRLPGETPLVDPIIEYRHAKSTTAFIDGAAVIGGYRYGRTPYGKASDVPIPELEGQYVFGNWSGSGVVKPEGEILVASPPENGDRFWSLKNLRIAGSSAGNLDRFVCGFGRGREGELYVLTVESFRPTGDSRRVSTLVPAEHR
jgi:hypothetical protein